MSDESGCLILDPTGSKVGSDLRHSHVGTAEVNVLRPALEVSWQQLLAEMAEVTRRASSLLKERGDTSLKHCCPSAHLYAENVVQVCSACI